MARIHQQFERWLRDDGAASRTASEYGRVLRKAAPSGDEPRSALEAWYVETVRGKSRSTQVAYAAALRKWADWRDLGGLNLPKPKGAKAREYRDALTDDEYERYRRDVWESDLPIPVKTVLLLLPDTGLRITEACSLHWSQHKTDGKGRRILEIQGKRERRRRVPLNAVAQHVIDLYCKWPGAPQAGFLFPSPLGDAPYLSPKTVRAHLDALRRRKGWDGTLERVSPHVLRHTFASRLVNRGVSVKHIQVLLGHANVQTTQVYLHPDDDSLHAATDAIMGRKASASSRQKRLEDRQGRRNRR